MGEYLALAETAKTADYRELSHLQREIIAFMGQIETAVLLDR